MKLLIAILTIFALLCTTMVGKVDGQVVVIGHVTAEVVESVSTSSMAVTSFNLKTNNINATSTINEAGNLLSETISLGSITIKSGTSMACNLVIHSANIKDSNGDKFTINPSLTTLGRSDTRRADGTQTIKINGIALMSSRQASGLYRGSYTMVFAYN